MRLRRSTPTKSLSTQWITTCWIDHRPTLASAGGTQSRSSFDRPRIDIASFSPPPTNWSISLRSMADLTLRSHEVVPLEVRARDQRGHPGDEREHEQPRAQVSPSPL